MKTDGNATKQAVSKELLDMDMRKGADGYVKIAKKIYVTIADNGYET